MNAEQWRRHLIHQEVSFTAGTPPSVTLYDNRLFSEERQLRAARAAAAADRYTHRPASPRHDEPAQPHSPAHQISAPRRSAFRLSSANGAIPFGAADQSAVRRDSGSIVSTACDSLTQSLFDSTACSTAVSSSPARASFSSHPLRARMSVGSPRPEPPAASSAPSAAAQAAEQSLPPRPMSPGHVLGLAGAAAQRLST